MDVEHVNVGLGGPAFEAIDRGCATTVRTTPKTQQPNHYFLTIPEDYEPTTIETNARVSIVQERCSTTTISIAAVVLMGRFDILWRTTFFALFLSNATNADSVNVFLAVSAEAQRGGSRHKP